MMTETEQIILKAIERGKTPESLWEEGYWRGRAGRFQPSKAEVMATLRKFGHMEANDRPNFCAHCGHKIPY